LTIEAIHPGEHLAEELHELGMSPAEFARNLGVPTSRVSFPSWMAAVQLQRRRLRGWHISSGPAGSSGWTCRVCTTRERVQV